MPITKYPNGVSSFGVPVFGGGDIITTGTIFFVDSNTGNNANDGLDPDHPVADIDYAVGLCTANKGDYIICMPNHTENITAAGSINLDKEGITVRSLGIGNNRAELIWTSSSAADIDVGADSITMENIVFNTGNSSAGSTGAPTGCIDVNDNHFSLLSCEINGSGAAEAELCVVLDENADDFKMLGCIAYSSSGGADAIVSLQDTGSALRGVEIAWCEMSGDFDLGAVYTTASTIKEINIHHNHFRNDAAGIACVPLGDSDSTNEGYLAWNVFDVTDSDALSVEILNKSTIACAENYATVSSVGSVSGLLTPPVYAS